MLARVRGYPKPGCRGNSLARIGRGDEPNQTEPERRRRRPEFWMESHGRLALFKYVDRLAETDRERWDWAEWGDGGGYRRR